MSPLPGRGEERGGLHPVTKARLRIEKLFRRAGFDVASGPEIEDDFHNFEALNIPPDHPARAMHDTFYFPDGRLLRTHTSPVQIRAMLAHGAPIAIIAPGRVYRSDYDMTHSPMFHQLEGLVVGENVSFANMKAALHRLPAGILRARPGHAPAAVLFPVHRALRRSRHVVRVLRGQGLPHLQADRLAGDLRLRHGASRRCCKPAAIDPERYTGYAFGMGIDRLAMLRYGVNDLRLCVRERSALPAAVPDVLMT